MNSGGITHVVRLVAVVSLLTAALAVATVASFPFISGGGALIIGQASLAELIAWLLLVGLSEGPLQCPLLPCWT